MMSVSWTPVILMHISQDEYLFSKDAESIPEIGLRKLLRKFIGYNVNPLHTKQH